MNLLDLFENREQRLTEGVRVVDQDYDLDQLILTMDINGRRVNFTYTDYDEDFDNAERGDVHDQLQRNDWYATLSHPDRMEILDAAYRAIRGEEPGEYRPTVDDEPLDEQGVAEGRADSANPLQRTIDFAVKNGYQVKTSPKRTRATFINRDIDHEIRATLYREPGDDMIWVNFDDRNSGMSGNDPADTFYDTFVRAYQDAAQDVSAGHADQQRKIFKWNGQPVGEVGIDRESSPGVGQYYMKHYASGTDNSGYDSFEEAVEELRHLAKQGVAEAMKPSDVPPAMRQRLSMRDIEAERPAGAFRFRVTFPDGHTNDYMTFDAAKSAADREKGRITRLSEDQGRKSTNARIERILKQLRARHPQAEDDLEALIYDFRSQQSQDRRDIARLDQENDIEEEDIQRLEKMLDVLRRRNQVAESGSKKKIRRDADENIIDEAKKDACYHKVRSRYKVWPSAYASGALVQCRKKGAANWGEKSKR